MKRLKKLSLIIGVALLALATENLKAQSVTNAPPVSPGTFFQSAEGYFTAFNTNYTWSGVKLEVSIGADYQNGMQWGNSLQFQYDLNTSNALDGIDLGYRMRNEGMFGSVIANEGGIGYNLISYADTRVEFFVWAGYDNQYNCALVEPEIDLLKKITPNTFAALGLSLPYFVGSRAEQPNKWVPDVQVKTGFTF